MKHIKPIHILLENRAPRQLHTLYYISDNEIKGRSQLPHMDYRTGTLVPTYYLIQDAVRASAPGDHIYQCVVKAALGTELQLESWLLERGYDPEEYFDSLQSEHKLPNGMDPNEFSDFRWTFDGLEIGELVLTWELSYLTDTMSEVSAHQIEKIREKLR